MKWSFFIGSCILASILLMALNAPVLAIAAGIVLAALVNWKKQERKSLSR
jgi:hypothetical protein